MLHYNPSFLWPLVTWMLLTVMWKRVVYLMLKRICWEKNGMGKTLTVNVCGPERNFHNADIYNCQGLFTLRILQMIFKKIFLPIYLYIIGSLSHYKSVCIFCHHLLGTELLPHVIWSVCNRCMQHGHKTSIHKKKCLYNIDIQCNVHSIKSSTVTLSI